MKKQFFNIMIIIFFSNILFAESGELIMTPDGSMSTFQKLVLVFIIIIFTSPIYSAIRFKKVSILEMKKIIDSSPNKTEGIKKVEAILHEKGYQCLTSHPNQLLYKKYSFLVFKRDIVEIDLTKYQADLEQEKEERRKKLIAKEEKQILNKPPKIKLGILNRLKMNKIQERLDDEILYEYVLTEVEEEIRYKGLWAKAYADSEGNEKNIEPLYMQYRVQSIKDRLVALNIAYNSMKRETLFTYIKTKLEGV